jgi:hypothetical protein
MHNQFEELCAFAISGQISDTDRMLLDEHMRECEDCRSFVEDMRTEVPQLAPAMAELMLVSVVPPDGIRERFLQKAAEAGFDVKPGAPVQQLQAAPEKASKTRSRRWGLPRWLRSTFIVPLPAAAAFATICLFAIYVAFRSKEAGLSQSHVATLREQSKPMLQLQPRTSAAVREGDVGELRLQDEQLKRELARVREQLGGYSAKQQQLLSANEQLSQSLASAKETADRRSADLLAQRDEMIAASKQVAALHQQLDEANSKANTLDAVANVQEKLTEEAQQRVAGMKDEMDKLYASRGSVESLVASRNLHIIDVYDTSGSGGRQGAFGRVFFVEGKSLVFYAYDLPTSKREKIVNFQLWGEGQGAEPTTYKLGLMHPDTNGGGRWVVSCDDPKVLKQLRAVYIAPPSARSEPPSQSRKMMYALLGQANHP